MFFWVFLRVFLRCEAQSLRVQFEGSTALRLEELGAKAQGGVSGFEVGNSGSEIEVFEGLRV